MFIRLLGLCLALGAGIANAQQMQVDLLSDGTLVIGVVSNADGTPAAQAPVQIARTTQPQTTLATVQTDTVGIFTYTGDYGASYRIRVGDVAADITLGEAPPEPFTWPPIYITLGILLLLSLIPARMLRRKNL